VQNYHLFFDWGELRRVFGDSTKEILNLFEDFKILEIETSTINTFLGLY
jgi:hypothetical protein